MCMSWGLGLRPVRVGHRLGRSAAQVSVGEDHPPQQLLHALRHLPLPNPLSSQSALPVPLEVVLSGKLLAFGVFEWCAAYEDFKERDSE